MNRLRFSASALSISTVLTVVFAGGCRTTPTRADKPVTATEQSPSADAAIVTLSGTESPDSVELVQHQSPDSRVESELTAPAPAESIGTPLPIVRSIAPQPVEYFVGVAMGNHPRVRAARARVAAASQRAPQARSLEDPVLSNNFYPISDQALQTAAGRAGNTLSITQKYPWPEKRRTRAAIADRETKMAMARLDQVELEIEEMVRLAYYELWFADRALEITGRNREIAAELITLAKARNEAGGSQQDVLRAQLQVDSIDDRFIGLARQKALAQADLAALMQVPEQSGIEPESDLNIASSSENIEELFAAAAHCSPKLRELRWAVARDREKQQLACLNHYPDFSIGAGWQTITESAALSGVANGHDNVSFMVGLTLPIWKERINASVRESTAEATATSRDLYAARDDTYRQIRRLVEQAEAAEEQLRLYNDRVLPRAKQVLQIASADYRGRLVDFGEVTDGFTEVLMFELQVARAEATLAGTVAQLKRAVGCEVLTSETAAL